MAPRSATPELAAFLNRFAQYTVAQYTDLDLRAWIKSLRTGTERTLYGAWLACADGESMLHVLGADLREKDQGSEVHRRLILATCACARLALVHVPPNEPRPAQALEIVERWARGDPSADLVEAERIAGDAWAAVDVHDAPPRSWGTRHAAWGAWLAARAARHAASAGEDAGWTVQRVARSAQSAALARGASEAEAEAAYHRVLAQCADLVRGVYPRPPYRDPIAGSEDEATYWLQIVDDPSVDPAARQAAGVRVLEIEAEIQGG